MSLFEDKTKDQAIKIILNHYSIACNDRIETLIEDSCRGMNCNCDIKQESCTECDFWADGVKNYQICLQDIKDFKNRYMKESNK
jgi:hypothetical protein|tara:strand:+ start:3116 stop:3367 length:252 start_codon:yes stop_codon:yes gene_type:complete